MHKIIVLATLFACNPQSSKKDSAGNAKCETLAQSDCERHTECSITTGNDVKTKQSKFLGCSSAKSCGDAITCLISADLPGKKYIRPNNCAVVNFSPVPCDRSDLEAL